MTKSLLAWVHRQVYELNMSALRKDEISFQKLKGKAEAYIELLEWLATEQTNIEIHGTNITDEME